ncbi:MAG: transporter substrate-binding domain-containing protein [Eggerthellaceae bacterium]|nr:transporter substrate-binding domain-containing protein [Eggerthellaceae bacterium]
MNKKKLAALLCASSMIALLALVGCTGNNAPATGEAQLVKEGVLTVGSDCDYPPFILLEGDQPVGFEFDLLEAIAADLGLELEYMPPQNFDTLLTTVAGGVKMDIACSSITITEERQQTVDFCSPYFDSNQACVVQLSATYASAKELEGKTVGAQSGTTGEAWANEHLQGVTVKPYNQASEGLAALQAGEIEALFIDAPIAEHQIANNYPNMRLAEVIPTGEQYGFAINKDNSVLKSQIDASMQKLVDNGTYKEIFKKYFPNLEPSIH